MIVVMKGDSTEEQLCRVEQRLRELGVAPQVVRGSERVIVACIGSSGSRDKLKSLQNFSGVEKVIAILPSYRLSQKSSAEDRSIIEISDSCVIGGAALSIIAGPCAVESAEQLFEVAHAVKKAGAHALRGGAFKPRSSAYSFSGLGQEGLELLAEARRQTGLPIVSEVLDPRLLDTYHDTVDVLQIGARNMQNFPLLRAAAETGKPILLKRGMAATIEELLQSAEHILAAGNPKVILCERGVRTFDSVTRNMLDLSAIPVLRERTHLPVLVDPSHGTGVARYVTAMSCAAVAAGADGIICEVHPAPEDALSDGQQSLTPTEFAELMEQLRGIATVVGRSSVRVRPVAEKVA